MTSNRKTKVFWTYEEKLLISKTALSIRATGFSTLDSIHQAIDKLPAGRRRKIAALSVVPDIVKMMEDKDLKLPTFSTIEPPPPPPDIPSGKLYDLVQELAGEFAVALANHLEIELKRRLQNVIQSARHEVVEEATSKRRRHVLIMGPQGQQRALLLHEYAPMLDIRFADDKDANDVIKLANNSDAIIVWTKFVSHHNTKNLPRDKSVLIHGGMDQIREELNRIYTA